MSHAIYFTPGRIFYMKQFILPALILISILCKSQTIDSTEIKLSHVKELFIKNLITAQEYEQMRQQILGIQPQKPQPIVIQQAPKQLPKADSMQLDRLWVLGNGNCVGGTVLLLLSTGCWVAGAVIINKNLARGTFSPLEVALPILSAVTFIPGVCLIVEGSRQMHRYHQYRPKELAISIYPSGAGLAYKF